MIIFNNTNDLINGLQVEDETLKFHLHSMKKTKNILLRHIQNFANSNNSIDLNSVNTVANLLNSLKASLNYCNENIAYIESLINSFNIVLDCANNNIPNFKNSLDEYNAKYVASYKYIIENFKTIDNCIYEVSKNSEIQFPDLNTKTNSDIQSDYVYTQNQQESNTDIYLNNTSSSMVENSSSAETTNSKKYVENTLIVSERNGNVVLPYTVSELNNILEQHPNRYYSIDSIIAKKYTMPLKNFKNSFISRFREAFKLMRHKEHSSIRDALDLGLELMFYYKLHPAIISGCKNLEELDTYLDYLEMGRVDKFDCFKIIFELPLAVHNKT